MMPSVWIWRSRDTNLDFALPTLVAATTWPASERRLHDWNSLVRLDTPRNGWKRAVCRYEPQRATANGTSRRPIGLNVKLPWRVELSAPRTNARSRSLCQYEEESAQSLVTQHGKVGYGREELLQKR